MRAADRVGLRHARARVAGNARGDTLEIGIGTGSNLGIYHAGAIVHGVDLSGPALSLAADRAGRSSRRVILVEGDAAALPYADASFDTVVATFVLCSVGDVGQSLPRPGGCCAPAAPSDCSNTPARASGDRCTPGAIGAGLVPRQRRLPLDHDVRQAVHDAGLVVIEERSERRTPPGDRRGLTPSCILAQIRK